VGDSVGPNSAVQDLAAATRVIRDDLAAAFRVIRDTVSQVTGHLAQVESLADARVRQWSLYSGEESGGLWCAQDGCGCAAEQSEILEAGWTDGLGNGPRFTLGQAAEAVAAHIAVSDERHTDEREG
jgi:hypothetical protein